MPLGQHFPALSCKFHIYFFFIFDQSGATSVFTVVLNLQTTVGKYILKSSAAHTSKPVIFPTVGPIPKLFSPENSLTSQFCEEYSCRGLHLIFLPLSATLVL